MSEASKTPEEQLEQNYAEIGRDFCDQILKWEPNYSWNESPLEYLFQLADQRDEALDRAQRAEAERDDLIHDIARHLAICSEQSSKIAELEKALAEQNQPPKLYSTDHCGKHRGQGFILSSKTTPYLYPTCPLCEQEALASSGQGEGK